MSSQRRPAWLSRLPPWARRVLVLLLGGTLILVGVVLLVFPGPGILFILAGVAVLAWEFPWAHRLLAWARSRLRRRRGSQPPA
jgi:uncharacterized protein (TIGR02611 family)